MNIMINILKEAGQIALDEQSKLKIDIKSDKSIVTNGDLKVSLFLEKTLKDNFPDFEIFSEENCNNLPKGNKIIVIDPIDGTQSYSQGQDTWCILIGFIEDNIITQGYIYQPKTNSIYYAEKGKGSFLLKDNKIKKLGVKKTKSLKAVLSPNAGKELLYTKSELNITNIEFVYGAGLKIAMIANGLADIYPNFQQKCSLWDIVAPYIILEEAGGTIIFKTPLIFDYKNPLINIDFCAVGNNLKHIKI